MSGSLFYTNTNIHILQGQLIIKICKDPAICAFVIVSLLARHSSEYIYIYFNERKKSRM